jgi:hypothetical protein
VPTEQVSTEKFNFEELTPGQVAALHQERLTQHIDRSLNQWGIMINNGSESLNNVFMIARQLPVCAIIENIWHKYIE